MFKDSTTFQASTDTLTPTKLLMENPMHNPEWTYPPAINDFSSFMTFDDNTAMFGQKLPPHPQEMMPPSPTDNNTYIQQQQLHKQPEEIQSPMTPPSPERETALPKKQRKKMLEKNREAAYRCRQKKKKWINGLEEKSQMAEARNKELQDQVSQLREESIYLRNLLLTHGNCNCDVLQAYLRRTSEQLSSTMPSLVGGSSPSTSGSESSYSNHKQQRMPSSQQYYHA